MIGINLEGKTFVVTGGTQGLGEAVARALAQAGAAGITICGRQTERGAQVAQALEELGCPALYVRADLSLEADCRQVIAAHDERFKSLSGLVNAAASTARGTLDSTTAAQWDAMMALNLRAPFILIQEAARIMRRAGSGGSIVNIGSVSGHGGQAFLTAYSTSKGALATLTKNAAHALLPDRIRVNCLNLGWMATPGEHAIQLAEGKPESWLQDADSQAPLGKILRPEEAAKLTAHLLSDDAGLMTGALIDYDQIIIGARE